MSTVLRSPGAYFEASLLMALLVGFVSELGRALATGGQAGFGGAAPFATACVLAIAGALYPVVRFRRVSIRA